MKAGTAISTLSQLAAMCEANWGEHWSGGEAARGEEYIDADLVREAIAVLAHASVPAKGLDSEEEGR